MLTLLGVVPGFPKIDTTQTGTVTYTYDSSTSVGSFDLSSSPFTYTATSGGAANLVLGPKSFQIHFKTDSGGNVVGGIVGADFAISGTVDLNGNFTADPGEPAGVLLTGEILEFGYQDIGATDAYDFRFAPTSGALLGDYAGKDAGVTMSSEASTFTGSFMQNFTGKVKATAGPIPVRAPIPAGLGDYVWHDLNANGIQEANEPGINGATVELLDGSSTVIDTTTTVFNGVNDGYYDFTNLTPGVPYTVRFTTPAGFDAVSPRQTGGAAVDSDGLLSDSVVLAPGEFNPTIDSGFYQYAKLGDFVWHDLNADGVQDVGEPGISGATVNLLNGSNAVIGTTSTDGDGYYEFDNLIPGVVYKVGFPTPSGFDGISPRQSTSNPGANDDSDGDTSDAVTLASGEFNPTLDSGFFKYVSVGNFVWDDANANGIQDSGEAGINGVTLTLTGTTGWGAPVALSTPTAGNGDYLFSNLAPGSYTVTVDAGNFTGSGALADYTATPTLQGGDTAIDSNPTPTGTTPASLPGGSSDLTLDFGYYKTVTVGDFVWDDANANGIQDGGEAGINGVTLTLTGTTGWGAPVTLSTTTAGDGDYLFSILAPGSYTVTVDASNFTGAGALADYTATPTLQGGDTAIDSNPTPTGTTPAALPGGSSDLTLDFGYYKQPTTFSISGKKYLDVTGNGLTYSDDTLWTSSLPNVTIKLFKDAGTIGQLDGADTLVTTTSVDSTGSYSFTGLQPGAYLVQEVSPTGYVRTAPTLKDYYPVSLSSGSNVAGIDFANAAKCCQSVLSNIYYIINGSTTVTDLRGKTHQGDTVTVHFTLTTATPQQFTLVSYTAPGASFDANTASQQQIFDVDTTGMVTSGTYELTVTNPNCYFQVDFVCGEAIDRFGPAGSNIFYTPQSRLFSADNGGTLACCDNTATGSLKGFVYVDANKDGVKQSGEAGISGVTILLKDQDGNVLDTTTTASNGSYAFTGLTPGIYTVHELQPSSYVDGKDSVGSLGGQLANDIVTNIAVMGGSNGVNYNFGEQLIDDCVPKLDCGDTASVCFWESWRGQSLIKCLNGSSYSTKLGNWLASTFPKIYGSSGLCLSGKSNSYVASKLNYLADTYSKRLDAEVMAVALAIYVTDKDLAGTTASSYGFDVNSSGTAIKTINVGGNGSAFGVSNYSTITVLQAVQAANNMAVNGNLYGTNTTLENKAYSIFQMINDTGNI